jgi:hypothetical protein
VTTFDHPDEGIELDWLALDVDEHVGLFSTGGYGPVPRVVVERLEDVERAIGRLSLLKVVGPCADSPVGSGHYESWTEPCRRGLFGFDWGPVRTSPYSRLTVPSRPVHVRELDDALVGEAAALVRLSVDFQLATAIQVEDLGVELFHF